MTQIYIYSFFHTLLSLTFSFLSFRSCDVAGLLVPTSVRQRVYSVVHRLNLGFLRSHTSAIRTVSDHLMGCKGQRSLITQ